MHAIHRFGDISPPTFVFLTERSEDIFDLKRRLGDSARLVVGSSAGDPKKFLDSQQLGPDDALVIDQRDASPAQRAVVSTAVRPERMRCRLLVIDTARDPKSYFDRYSNLLTVGPSELPTAFAVTLRHGLGRHDLLIDAMRALMQPLTMLGRRFVAEVLATRFLHHRVAAVAERLGMHRTRLHHRLVDVGDPSPKQLIDACYAMTTALVLREPILRTPELLQLVRTRHLRTPRDAVRRCLGMDLASLRRLALRDTKPRLQARITRQMMSDAESQSHHRSRRPDRSIS